MSGVSKSAAIETATVEAVETGADAPIPRHVAIIMDGNGRWANARGLPRAMGHRQGVEAVRRTVRAAGELGVSCLTLYSFSTENWTRPPSEVSDLMGLLRQFAKSDLEKLSKEGVRVRIVGSREGLEPDLLKIIDHAETSTAKNTRLNLQIAFNYGGRDELLRAARRIAEAAARGEIDPARVGEADLSRHLDTDGLPDPDLVVRTSGEKRLSNFLIWQSAYAEFVFQDVLWPDYRLEDLAAAIEEYQRRERRYGGVERRYG
ncbi:MAG: isoprenyl transferase [Pseudomonadota bacterium]